MRRPRLLAGALGAAVLAALASAVRPAPETVAAKPRLRESVAARSAPAVADSLDYGRAFVQQPLPGNDDAFRARSWTPPPPPPEKLVPPKPVAPALPFSFSGVMEDGGVKTLFLRRGELLVSGHEREVLEAVYRVEAIGEDSVVLTYLPLDERQILVYPK